MRSPLRFAEVPEVGGVHVATVNMSIAFRMKNFGKVPPIFETLFFLMLVRGRLGRKGEYVRCEESHVGTAVLWIRYLCVES
jgi:hypothetical protein